MSKRLVLVFVLVFSASIIIGGVIAYFFMGSKKGTSKVPTYIQNAPLNQTGDLQSKPTADLTYKDASGFSFSYPSGVKVVDETPNDAIYYTVLSLTKDSTKIVISVLDTDSKSVDDYVKTSSAYQGATLYGAVTLGGMSAKQYSLNGKLVTLAIDLGVIYQIDGPKDNSFWEETQNIVISSFALAQANSIVEEEEIVVQ